MDYASFHLIHEDSWQKMTYHGQDIYFAKSKLFEGNLSLNFGFCINNLAFLDEEGVINDNLQYIATFKRLQKLRAPLPGPFTATLLRSLSLNKVSDVNYAEQITVPIFWSEELQHAKDQIYANLSSVKSGKKKDSALALLKPQSALKKLIEQSKDKASQSIFSRSVLELSGKVGGLICVLEEFIAKNQEEYALIAFYSFMAEVEMYAQKELIPSDPSSVYVITAKHVNSGLHDSMNFRSSVDVINYVDDSGIKALNVLNQLYQFDFYNETERTENLN